MNKQKIDILLNKYWEAESSVAEEETLKEYFLSEDIHADHMPYKKLFSAYRMESKRQPTRKLSLTKEMISKYDKKESKISRIRPLLKYAATLLLLIAAFSYFSNQFNYIPTDTMYAGKYTEFVDPEQSEEALEITLDALSFLGVKINNTETEISKNLIPIRKAISKVN